MSDDDFVPVVHMSAKPGGDEVEDRIKSVLQSFREKFDQDAEVVVRVPGRVNIIGEHIDYCGYAVLPMAIENDVLLAARRSSDQKIRLSNRQQDKYPDFECEVIGFPINQPPEWSDYFLCGLTAMSAGDDDEENDETEVSGMSVLVDGCIPPSAGLSSSSALVVGSALLSHILILGQEMVRKSEVAAACAKYERLIGTEGGGMDQAIQMLAQSGSAHFVQFVPELRTTPVRLPDSAVFFVSHSGVSCNKAATSHYNTRVLETRLAALLIYHHTNTPVHSMTLSGVQRALNVPVTDMGPIVDQALHKEPYSMDEILQLLELQSVSHMFLLMGLTNGGNRFDEAIRSPLKLHDRASHVYEEAARVLEFKRVCEDDSLDDEAKVLLLGSLMNQSHESLRDKFECSVRQLDELVRDCRSSGASGSRLTGAGWGGACLSLVPSSKVEVFRSDMSELYPEDTFTFQTKPCAGACVFRL